MSDSSGHSGPERRGLEGLFTFLRGLLRVREGTLRENIEEVIEEHESGSEVLKDEERAMLLNVLEIGERRVEDVMIPRADIIGVELSTPLPELVRLFRDAAHSRLPVYRETLDDPVGMVHIKDVIDWWPEDGQPPDPARGQFSLAKVKRDLIFVPPSKPVLDLLITMRATRIHMALVIDEYGGTDGLVTIEDLVEEIVGEIRDEHEDPDEPALTVLPGGIIEADGRAEIEDVEARLGLQLSGADDDDYDTLGGLVFAMAGRIPARGEIIRHPAGLDIEIIDADPRRIKRLRLRPVGTEAPIPAAGP